MAILEFMPISELVKFIPPQCQEPPEEKLSFQDYMRARLLHKFNHTRARGSPRFALALLAPMLVSDEQQHTNNGSVVGFYATEHPRAEGVDPEIDPRSGHETVLEQRVAENGYVFIQIMHGKPITYHIINRDSLCHAGRKAIPGRSKPSWPG
jgi:hypothetical protein